MVWQYTEEAEDTTQSHKNYTETLSQYGWAAELQAQQIGHPKIWWPFLKAWTAKQNSMADYNLPSTSVNSSGKKWLPSIFCFMSYLLTYYNSVQDLYVSFFSSYLGCRTDTSVPQQPMQTVWLYIDRFETSSNSSSPEREWPKQERQQTRDCYLDSTGKGS